ncbi:unnamed protein product [Parnassius apollo]|uniref:(apollo) hypothetical protein n=1 Tax=Parnassius apollo TaxID=110799 RepID=A0A8S3W8B0_PARAO|nr:unnamed protein product [Parnassius apollo]
MHRFFAELEPSLSVTEQNLVDRVRYILRSNIFGDAELERLRREAVPSSDGNAMAGNAAPLIAHQTAYVDAAVDIPVVVDSDGDGIVSHYRTSENEEHIGRVDAGNAQYTSRKSIATSPHTPKQAKSCELLTQFWRPIWKPAGTFARWTHYFLVLSLCLPLWVTGALAKKGHNITVISYFPQNQPIKNYHDISLAEKLTVFEGVFPEENSFLTILKVTSSLVQFGTKDCKTLLEDKNVQNLWKTKSKFDVVVTEQFNSDCSLGLAHILNAPVVGLTTHSLMPWHFSRFGVPFNPSYVSFMYSNGGTKPTLYQKVESFIIDTYLRLIYKYLGQRVDQSTLAQYFDDIPPLEELGHNIKFQLLYTNFVHVGSNIFPQNVIEVGGYHVANPKQLPEDLRKFIETSQHGVIYISFGSLIRTAAMPRDKLETILSTLSELPQRVIWKWEEDSLPGNLKKIYISNWLPQNDILGHPNVVAFYSHCGLLGTTEALYHGVPVLGMPLFGDQPSNAAAIEESGLGVQIELKELTKENLLKKVQDDSKSPVSG